MRKYFCYVFYNEQWEPYYVGKGNRRRYRDPHRVPVADDEHTQFFHFDTEWEAYECEVELISFWGRQCDGGVLLNVSHGGPGCPGVIPNASTRKKLSEARLRLPHNLEIVEKMNQARVRSISLVHTITGEVRFFASGRDAADALNMSQQSVAALRSGRRKTIFNWSINK